MTKTSKKVTKKVPPAKRKKDEDYDSDTSSTASTTTPTKSEKMSPESTSDYRAELKARYKLAMQATKRPSYQDKLYTDKQKIVKKNSQQALWKGLKFFKDEENHLVQGAKFVMPYCGPTQLEGLQGKDLEMETYIWVHENADIVRCAINKRRNYAKDEYAKVVKKAFAKNQEHMYPTPEDVEDLVLRRGFDDFANKAEDERMMVKFTNMVDYGIAKVATNHYWGEALKYTEPMLTAMSYKDTGMQPMHGVSPSDLAFFVVMIQNYYPLWLHDGLEQRYFKEKGWSSKGEDDQGTKHKYVDAEGNVIQRPQTKYTEADQGVPRLGGWNRAGRKAFYKLLKEIMTDEKDKKGHAQMLAIDEEALRRMRERHGIEEKETKRAKRNKPKAQFLDKADDESDMEEIDCLDG